MARRGDWEAELDDEIRQHLELYADDLVAQGMGREEAQRRARLRFGTVDAVKEGCREVREPVVVGFLRDLGHGFARLRRRPGFTAVALVTLALVIGANSAVFSLIDAVLLRPLPYPEAERLGRVQTLLGDPAEDSSYGSVDGRSWEVVRDATPALLAAPYSDWTTGVNLVVEDDPAAPAAAGAAAGRPGDGRVAHVRQQRVGAGFFSVLGVEPVLGRGFRPAEDRPGGAAVVVLSHELWRDAFAAAPGVPGRTVTLRGEPFTVVGVMPEGFRSTTEAELWTPLRPSTDGEGGGANYGIVTRLAPGATWEQARAQLAAASQTRFPAADGAEETSSAGNRLAVRSLQESAAAGLRRPLALLWAAVALVLVIGCVNLAGLLLAQGAARSREIATRMAIGGGRAPIVRQLFAEGLALALAGGAAGLGVALLAVRGLEEAVASTLGITQDLRLDARVVLATLALSVVASLLFSAYPAWSTSRLGRATATGGGLRDALGSGGRTAGGHGRRMRGALLVGQVALAVVLLAGASLLAGSLGHLSGKAPGFEPDGLVAARVSLDDAGYRTSAAVDALLRDSLRRVEESPAVAGAGVALSVPYERPLNSSFRLPGDDAETYRTTNLVYVTPGYFEVLGTPLLAGRALTAMDGRPDVPRVALANRAFVDTYLDGVSPLGRRLRMMADTEWEVVGVVADTMQRPGFGDYEPLSAVPALYVPAARMSDEMTALVHGWFSPSWVVRVAGGGAAERRAAVEAVRDALRATAPGLPVAEVKTFAELRRDALRFEWLLASLLSGLAVLALVLTAVGLAGLVSGIVEERRRALGIRLALGSTRARAIRSVVLPALALTAGGLVAGVALGPLAARLLRGFLHGITPDHPGAMTAVAAGMLGLALVASLVPALRIVRIDPARNLRAE